MTARSLRLVSLAAGFVGALMAASPSEAGAIRLGMTTWVGYGPLFLARDLGYFKDAGLDVELKIIEESSIYMAAVASGELDGSAATVDEMMKWRRPDFCFKSIVALDDSHGGDGVLATNDVKAFTDIKGKDVALNEGSVSEFWFNLLLTKNGMTESDVNIVNMTSDDAAAAFIGGRIPVAVTWEPHLTETRKSGQGQVLVDSSTTPGAIVDVVSLTCDIVEKRPDEVKAFVSAYYKAVEYIKANPDKAYEIMAKGVGGYLADPKDFAESAKGVNFYDRARNIAFFGTPEKGELADLLALANKVWLAKGTLSAPIDYAAMIDPSFISSP